MTTLRLSENKEQFSLRRTVTVSHGLILLYRGTLRLERICVRWIFIVRVIKAIRARVGIVEIE
jgi:hypothetical protein